MEVLSQKGYQYFNEATKGILYRECDQHVYVVTLSPLTQENNVQFYNEIQRKVEWFLANDYGKKVKCLHIVFSNVLQSMNECRNLLEQFSNIWLVENNTGKLFVYEHQISDFDNLRNSLEIELKKRTEQYRHKNTFRFTPINTGIVALNVLVLIGICLIQRDFFAVYDPEVMLSMGALSYETFMNGAWYQIITSFFLHFGFSHLLNNMILLLYTGCELERRIGSLRYFIIYFGVGIIGNLVSLVYYHGQGTQVVSAGASGAVFGIIGALFALLIIHQFRTPELSPTRLLFMIVITIYHGITSTGVDNAAHIGGLLAGFISGFLLSKISRYGKLE